MQEINIKCCLCPLYHGGLKPTTDGRWVHFCCALWANECTTIIDVNTMRHSYQLIYDLNNVDENDINEKIMDMLLIIV